jgi:cell division protein FtsL
MIDESIKRLQSDWQSQPDTADIVIQRLRRNRWRPHAALVLELFGCTLALVTGIWFVWIATRMETNRVLFILSACVLLVAAPALAIATFAARRAGLRWDESTPENILQTGIRRTEGALRVIRIARWHIVVIAGFVAVLWVLQFLGAIDAQRFLSIYTLICIAISSVALVWSARRERQLHNEQAVCARLLDDLRAESADG